MTGYPTNPGSNGSASYDNTRLMTAIFHNRDEAENAYDKLLSHGFSRDDINLVMSDETRKRHFEHTTHTDTDMGSKAMENVGSGSAIGGTVGAVAGAIAAIGTTLALPGLGLIIAGPLAAAFAGAGVGGLAGGLIGALTGAGVAEDTARSYETGLQNGGIVVGVRPRSTADEQYLMQHGFH